MRWVASLPTNPVQPRELVTRSHGSLPRSAGPRVGAPQDGLAAPGPWARVGEPRRPAGCDAHSLDYERQQGRAKTASDGLRIIRTRYALSVQLDDGPRSPRRGFASSHQ